MLSREVKENYMRMPKHIFQLRQLSAYYTDMTIWNLIIKKFIWINFWTQSTHFLFYLKGNEDIYEIPKKIINSSNYI